MEGNPDIVSIYSEFILGFRESGDRTIPIWRSDPKLQKNMQRLVELDRDATKEFWARYFLKVLREELKADNCGEQDYAKRHLFAYLQKPCHFAALKLSRKHSNVDLLRRQYTYQDYCQIGNSFAVEPAKLLQNFLLDSPFAIQAYAKKRLEGLVLEKIRKENPQIKWRDYTKWGLLRNTRVTELRAALNGRINQNKVEQLVRVWQCFKEIYAPKTSTGSRHLDSPNEEEFQQIAQRYNQRRLELSEPGEAVDKGRVRQMLEECISGVRDWRTVSFSYPDANRDVFDSTSGERWDVIPQNIQGYPSNEPLFKLEQEEQWHQLNAILSEAFDQLPVYDQNLLRLYFGLEATQAEIAEVLNLQQYQVSRQLKRCKRLLLKAFAQKSRETLNLHLSNETITQLDAPMDDWLEKHCKSFLFCLLETVLAEIGSENKTLFQLFYRDRWSQEKIALELQIPIADLSDRLTSLQKLVTRNFVTKLASNIEVPTQSVMPLFNRIADFITVCSIH